MTVGEYGDFAEFVFKIKAPMPAADALKLGGIIGMVDLVDVVETSKSPWFIGPYNGFVLKNPRPLPFHARGSSVFSTSSFQPWLWARPCRSTSRKDEDRTRHRTNPGSLNRARITSTSSSQGWLRCASFASPSMFSRM